MLGMKKRFKLLSQQNLSLLKIAEKGLKSLYISIIKVIRNEKTFYNVVSAKSQLAENCWERPKINIDQ